MITEVAVSINTTDKLIYAEDFTLHRAEINVEHSANAIKESLDESGLQK